MTQLDYFDRKMNDKNMFFLYYFSVLNISVSSVKNSVASVPL